MIALSIRRVETVAHMQRLRGAVRRAYDCKRFLCAGTGLQALCASRIETGARSVGESRQMCACGSRECPSQRSVERATQRCASTRVWEGLALEGRRTGYAAVSWGGATAGSGRGASGGESGSCERRPSAPTRSNERHARSTHTAATREPWLDGKAGNPNMCVGT